MSTHPLCKPFRRKLLKASIDKLRSSLYLFFTVAISFLIAIILWFMFPVDWVLWIWVDPWFCTFHKSPRSFWHRWASKWTWFRQQLSGWMLAAVPLGLNLGWIEWVSNKHSHSRSLFASRRCLQIFFPSGFVLSHSSEKCLWCPNMVWEWQLANLLSFGL